MSTTEQRVLWRQRATLLSQAVLAEEEQASVEVSEELVAAVLALLDEVQALEQDLRLERATRPRGRGWPR